MRLLVAEKPDQARAIAHVLDVDSIERDGYFDCGQDIVTFCKGHLYALAEPEAYDERYKAWDMDLLPIVIPDGGWIWTVPESSKRQVRIIHELLAKATSVVHCGDYDREGQLIVDMVLRQGGYDPAQALRFIARALDTTTILAALGDLKPNQGFLPLGQAAELRAEIDWSDGINLSRAYTHLARQAGYGRMMVVGRVKTPTLNIVVERDRVIDTFRPVRYYRVAAQICTQAGVLAVEWEPRASELGPQGLVVDATIAQRVAAAVEGATAVITHLETNASSVPPPLPHNLTSLTAEAFKRHRYTALQVLVTAQRLYERHALISYPRTEWRHLPENQLQEASRILQAVEHNAPPLAHSVRGADASLRSRAWDSSKIGSHHGIIPRGTLLDDIRVLTEEERNVYDIVARSYVAQFYPSASYDVTSVQALIANETFGVKRTTCVRSGWLDVYSIAPSRGVALPPVSPGDTATVTAVQRGDALTTPPERFNDATLTQAMSAGHERIDDATLRAALLEADGIGTPATRSHIIEDLVKYGLLARTATRELVSTLQGRELIEVVPDDIKATVRCAEHEQRLRAVADNVLDPAIVAREERETLCERLAYARANPPKRPLGATLRRADGVAHGPGSAVSGPRMRGRRKHTHELLNPDAHSEANAAGEPHTEEV